jgi:hypothetical protein
VAAYSSDGAEFTGGVLRVFDGSAWTGAQDNGYYWTGTAWTRFQPDNANDLGQPQSLAAVPGDLEAAFTWVDDTPKTVIPTHVQLRLPATTSVWVEVEYGTLEWDVAFLFPETAYQMQARYIRREDGSIVGTGPISEVFFSTLALDGPGAPAADPGGSGPDSTFNWGTPQGGPTCTWEYIVQTATTPASGFITWADTAVTGSFLGSLGSIDLDLVAAGLACGGLARFRYREVCGGVPADYLFGDPFTMVCDWDVACGGLDNSAWAGAAPLTDAILAMPKICVADAETMIIEDHIGTQVYGKLDGFSFMIQAGGQDVLVGKSGMAGWKPIAAGPAGDLALLTDADDASFTVKANLYDVPGGAGGSATDSFPIGRFGKNVALSAVRASASTWYARASWQKADGSGGTTLTGTTALALDEFNILAVTFDNSAGAVKLYVNGAEEITTTGEAAHFSDGGIGQDVELYGNDTIRITQVAAWDRELTPEEVASLQPLPIVGDIVYVSTGDVSTGFASSSGHIMPVDDNTLLYCQFAGQGVALIDITDRENPSVAYTYDLAGTGYEIIYAAKRIPAGATSVWINYYESTGTIYGAVKLSLTDLSVLDSIVDSAYTSWSGTSPTQKLIYHRVDADNYYAARTTQNYVNGSTGVSAGSITGGMLVGADGADLDWIEELGMGIGKRTTAGSQPVSLYSIGTPLNPTLETAVTFSEGNPGATQSVYVDADTLLIYHFAGGDECVSLHDWATNTEHEVVTGATEVGDGVVRLYEAESRKWAIHIGRTAGSDKYLVAREIIAGPSFDTKEEYVMLAADGLMTRFCIVDNYIYGDGNTGLVTYRIDA